MKLFIVISCFSLLFGFSASKLLIMRYTKLMNYWKLDEDKWENFVVENADTPKNLCKELKGSPIFTDESITNKKYHKHTATKSKPVVQHISVLVGFNVRTVSTLSCQYNGSMVYLAKHSNCEHLVLFEQEQSDVPSITAVAVKPTEFKNYNEDRSRTFHMLLKIYNSPELYNAWSERNFPLQEEIKLFQLCMTLLDISFKNLAHENIQLTLSGHVSKKRIKNEIYVHKTDDMNVAKELDLYRQNNENVNRNETEWMSYAVPTIKCDTFKANPVTILNSRITFFFVPHPEPNNNEIFFYYTEYDEGNLLLYLTGRVSSLVLKV